MWVPSALVDLFTLTRDAVDSTKQELAIVKAERDMLQRQLSVTQINFDWIKMQINTLQMERTALLEKAYQIKIPTPQLIQNPVLANEAKLDEFSFDDIGDKLAKQYGFPLHDKQ